MTGGYISTRKSFDADKKFDMLIRQAMQKQKIDFAELNRDHTYVFELVSPESTIVIPYPETKLYFLMCREITRHWKKFRIIMTGFVRRSTLSVHWMK